ncbi:DUF1178 family protein [Fluviibacterium sp. S390]|uniref:DUF1178 family protein n=1 Tax=Fluviibacterium sp. S390 TaxID=3415139 RepID=UPI003C7A77D1
MISYALKCSCGHRFDSWFQSGAAFDRLKGAGMVTCPSCGGSDVGKELMAPRVRPARHKAVTPDTGAPVVPETPTAPALSAPANSEVAEAIDKLRRAVEANTEDVGKKFATEARRIHEGTSPERAIRGQATAKDAKSLIDDGIPVLPLPFSDPKKTN